MTQEVTKASNSLPFFQGMEEKQVDAKNRVGIPGLFRSLLPEGDSDRVIVVRGLKPNTFFLEVWPLATWAVLTERVLSIAEPEKRHTIFRGYISQGRECKVDPQGRLVIPPFYREWAKIGETVTWVGGGEMMELWAKEVFEQGDRDTLNLAYAVYQELTLGVGLVSNPGNETKNS